MTILVEKTAKTFESDTKDGWWERSPEYYQWWWTTEEFEIFHDDNFRN